MQDPNRQVVPILKWPGGKRWFVQRHSNLLPSPINRYFEPFVGSASVFFSLQPRRAYLSDTNGDLITTYQAIRDAPYLVWRYLKQHARAHNDEYYYKVRASKPRSKAAIAAKLIYLNRTCWNGLYRVNRLGQFNVPRGTKNTVIFPTDDFELASYYLSFAALRTEDFESALLRARKDDFAFIDPPYTVRHNLNGFRKYNEIMFSWRDQERLAELCHALSQNGVRILMTNADHKSVRSLYKHDFELVSTDRKSIIAASKRYRTQVNELIIKNY